MTGRIGSFEGECCLELPPQAPGFWATLGPRVTIERPASLCIDCGTVWTQVDRETARKKITNGGSDETLDRLRIAAPRKRRWKWLLFGER